MLAFRGILIFLAITIFLVKDVYGTGSVSISLIDYSNPTGQTEDGACCDGVNIEGCPVGKCDLHFTLCVSQLDGTNKECKEFIGPQDRNVLNFTSKDEFLYSYDKWQGGVTITCNVTDTDTDGFQTVDYFSENFTSSGVDASAESSSFDDIVGEGLRSLNATRLVLRIKSYCDSYYYDDCSVKCIASDGCDGHYTCNATGHKVCNSGWTGRSCSQIIPGSSNDCSIYSNSLEVSQWRGKLKCSTEERNASLTIDDVDFRQRSFNGHMTISDVYAQVEGTVNSVGITFTSTKLYIGGSYNLSKFDSTLSLKNATFLDGTLGFLYSGENCGLTLHRTDEADDIDRCDGKGTCIRYGSSRTETYCCCYDGKQGLNCADSTLKPTLITPLPTSTAITSSTQPATEARTSTEAPSTSTHSSEIPSTSTASSETPSTEVLSSSVSSSSDGVSSTTPVPTSTSESPSVSTSQSTSLSQTEEHSQSSTESSPSYQTESTSSESEPTATTQSGTTTQSPETSTQYASDSTTESYSSQTRSSTESQSSDLPPSPSSPLTESTSPTETTTAVTPESTLSTTTVSLHSSPLSTTTVSPESTLPTTTEPSKPFVPNKPYRLAVAAAPEELDEEDSNLEDLITEAYYEANIDILEKDLIQTNVTERISAIGDEGTLVVEIVYMLTINKTDINITQPSTALWTTVLNRVYRTTVYTGINIWYLDMTYSMYYHGRPPVYLQYKDLENDIKRNWEANSSVSSTEFDIKVLLTEEYVGDDGEELFRLYYIVSSNGTVYNPQTLIAPPVEDHLLGYTLYTKEQKTRYRFAYGLLFYHSIETNELPEVATILEKTWNGVSHLNVSVEINRLERYMGKAGEYLIRVVYIVERQGKVVSPVIWKGPQPKNFKSWLDNIQINGRYLQVYTSDVNYRFSLHSGFYIADRIDTRDWTNFTNQIETTWSKQITSWQTEGFKVQIVTTMDYTTNKSEIVQLLTYFLYKGEVMVDASQLEFYYGINNQLKDDLDVVKTNGEKYEWVEETGMVELRTQFSFLVRGLVATRDTTYFEKSILSAWNNTEEYIDKELQVTLNYIEVHRHIRTGESVSKVYYSLRVNATAIDAYSVKVTQNWTREFSEYLEVFRQYQSYQVYTASTADLVPSRYSYSLYFSNKITRIDFDTLSRRLKSVLKVYMGIKYEFEILIAGTEEFLIPYERNVYQTSLSRQKVWKVEYYIKMGKAWLYPRFVRRVIVPEIMSQLQFELINKKTATFYLETSSDLISYNYHFSLNFKEPVFVTDWIQIRNHLEQAWRQQIGFSVEVSIQDLEQLVDQEGNIFYNLVYYLKTGNTWIYSANWQILDISRLQLDFLNVQGYKYQYFMSTESYRLSYAFHVGSDIRVQSTDIVSMTNTLQETWCYTLAMYVSNCSFIEIIPVNQESQTSESGITGWEFRYFVKYQGRIIDTATWPTINIEKFITYYESYEFKLSYKFFLNINALYRYFRYHLYLKTKVETKDYSKIKDAILASWKKENKEYNSSRDVTIVIDSQKEKINIHGESTWELVYHVEIRGNKLRPESTLPVNQSHLQEELETRLGGGKYELTSSVNATSSLISMDKFAGLVISHEIHSQEKIRIKDSLEAYYRNITNTGLETKVDVIIGPVRQVITAEGKLAWELSYHVAINGSSVSVNALQNEVKVDHLRHYLKVKTKYGERVELISTKSVHKSRSLFSVALSHKVQKVDITKVAAALEASFSELNPKYKNCSCLDVKVWKQQEQISESGKSSWKLDYAVSVGGRPVDASLVSWPSWSTLEKHLEIMTEAGYTIKAESTTNTTYTLTSLLHSIYFNSFVAKSSYTRISTELRARWSKVLTALGIKGNVDIKLRKDTELSINTGHSAWKLDYELHVNSTKLDTSAITLDKQNFEELQTSISNLTSPSGTYYRLLEASEMSTKVYAMHFPLVFTTPVAERDLKYIQKLLETRWAHYLHKSTNQTNMTKVEISQQKVLIDMKGKSVYKLVYYVTDNGDLIDSRLINYENVTSRISENLTMVNPRGQLYKIFTRDSQRFVREDLLFSTYINRPLTYTSRVDYTEFLKTVLETKYSGKNITVGVLQQEELLLESGSSIWKTKFFVQIDGEYQNPVSIGGLQTEQLYSALQSSNMTINFDLSQETANQTLYSYNDRFIILFRKNVSNLYWPLLQELLYSTWINTSDYSTCDCLKVVVKGVEEVVDVEGNTAYKLVYFLKRNDTVVKSMTSIDVNRTEFQELLYRKYNVDFQLLHTEERETTRTDSMISFYMSASVRLDHATEFSETLMNHLNRTEGGRIEILRQMEYTTVEGESVWRVDLRVESNNETVDARSLDTLNTTLIHEQLNETISGYEYSILPTTTRILDYRKSYHLYIQTSVRQTDLRYFSTAVYNYIRQSVSMKIHVTVEVPKVTQVIDSYGRTYEKLFVFVNFNGNPVYPGSGGVIDLSQLQTEIDSLGITGAKAQYRLVSRTETEIQKDYYHTYTSTYTVNKAVKGHLLEYFELTLGLTWRMALQGFKTISHLQVTIVRQDECTTVNGESVFRLVYYLSINNKRTPSNQLPELSEKFQQLVIQKLADFGITEYTRISRTSIVQYSSLFSFFMTKPVLLPDINTVQQRLSEHWNSKLDINNSNVYITSQEEVVDVQTSSSTKMWQVSYVLYQENNLLVDSNYQENLNTTDYKQMLDFNFTSSGQKYSSLYIEVYSALSTTTTIVRYKESFSVYFTQRYLETQYWELQTSLETVWREDRNESVNVTVTSQEEVITQAGITAWKLYYHVTMNNMTINSMYTKALAEYQLVEGLKISTSIGTTYKIAHVTSSFILEEAFQVYVSRAVFRVDRDRFIQAVKDELKVIMPDVDFNSTEVEWRSQTKFLNVKNVSQTIWRQLFVVKKDGVIISAQKQRKLTDLVVNMTSQDGINYEVVSTEIKAGFIKEENLFSLSVVGRIGASLTTLTRIVQSSWTKFDSSWTITLRQSEEFIGAEGEVVTRIPYFVTKNTTVAYPDATKAPEPESIVGSLTSELKTKYSVYSGEKLVRYDACFALSVKKEASLDIKYSEVREVIQQAWSYSSSEMASVTIEKVENFVGDFGFKIKQYLYTVRLNEVLTEPNFDVKPSRQVVQRFIDNSSYDWSLYSGETSYRLSVVYSINIAYSLDIVFNLETKQELESKLQEIWSSRKDFECSNCTIKILDRTTKRAFTETQETNVVELRYSVQSGGEYLKPYIHSPPTQTDVNQALNTTSYRVWQDEAFVTRSVYVQGYSRTESKTVYEKGLTEAWSTDTVTEVNVTVTKVNRFVDSDWNKISQVQYIVSLNGSDSTRPEPSTSEISQAFSNVTGEEKTVCSCKPVKRLKFYVKKSSSSINVTSIQTKIKTAYVKFNQQSTALSKILKVRARQIKSRTKRDVATDVPEAKYIGEDGEQLSPVEYSVSLDGQEPDPLFLSTPSAKDLNDAGLDNCDCAPRKQGSLKLLGTLGDDDKAKVKRAVTEAVQKANPDVLSDDLSVDILSVQNDIKDSEDNELSEVSYAVTRGDDGDLEDINYPSSAQLSDSLNKEGLTLYDKKKAPKKDDDSWILPVAITCGVLAALIIIIAVGCYIAHKRKQKKMNLKKQKENVANDIYDEENFSSAASYPNKAYVDEEGSMKTPHTFSNPEYETQEAKIDFKE